MKSKNLYPKQRWSMSDALRNNFLKAGQKEKSEKILLNLSKKLNKRTQKSAKLLVETFLQNNALLFDIKYLRKSARFTREIPYFLTFEDRLRRSLKELTCGIKKTAGSSCEHFFLELAANLRKTDKISDGQKNFYLRSFSKRAYAHFRWW